MLDQDVSGVLVDDIDVFALEGTVSVVVSVGARVSASVGEIVYIRAFAFELIVRVWVRIKICVRVRVVLICYNRTMC